MIDGRDSREYVPKLRPILYRVTMMMMMHANSFIEVIPLTDDTIALGFFVPPGFSTKPFRRSPIRILGYLEYELGGRRTPPSDESRRMYKNAKSFI